MNRQIRVDRGFIRRSQIAGAIFMLVIGGTVLWAVTGGDQSPAYRSAIAGAVVIGFASVASIVVSFIYYCCPRCNRRLSTVKEAEPAIHYYCPNCNIEWDSGWRKGRFS